MTETRVTQIGFWTCWFLPLLCVLGFAGCASGDLSCFGFFTASDLLNQSLRIRIDLNEDPCHLTAANSPQTFQCEPGLRAILLNRTTVRLQSDGKININQSFLEHGKWGAASVRIHDIDCSQPVKDQSDSGHNNPPVTANDVSSGSPHNVWIIVAGYLILAILIVLFPHFTRAGIRCRSFFRLLFCRKCSGARGSSPTFNPTNQAEEDLENGGLELPGERHQENGGLELPGERHLENGGLELPLLNGSINLLVH